VSLLPAAPRSRANADRTLFEFAPLEPDTTYRLTLEPGAARDLAGNPGTSTLSTFFLTSPAVPDSGAVLAFEGPPVHDFEVAFDEDGVLSVAAVLGEPAQAVGWGVFSPKTGRFESLAVPFAAGLRAVRLVAGLAGDGVMPPKRTFGLALERQRPGGTGLLRTAFWRFGDGAVQSFEGALAVVPKPGGCNENAPDTVGLAILGGSGALYRRAGRADEAIASGFLPRAVEARSPDNWEWFQDDGGVLRRQLRTCACGGGCGFTVPELVRTDLHPADPELSLAAPRANGRLYVFNDGMNARVEACYECGVGGMGTGACTLVGEQPGSVVEDLRVTSAKDGGRVLGARRREGTVELLERDLSMGCAGGWTVLAAPAEVANAVRFRPVRVGKRVGLLYLSPEDLALRLWLR
ncbi:MAG TPA: Ig-like domain-containing protein, partial [Longimicrobium sp.]|nr:Ig-like domain-containing protein [Longimicrobium sp.]